jgi:hypothetical protein
MYTCTRRGGTPSLGHCLAKSSTERKLQSLFVRRTFRGKGTEQVRWWWPLPVAFAVENQLRRMGIGQVCVCVTRGGTVVVVAAAAWCLVWARAHFPDTCPRCAGARDWDGRRTRHGWHLHTTRPCVKSSEAPSPLHLSTRPCAGGRGRLHASAEAHYGHDGIRSSGRARRSQLFRQLLSKPNAGSTKLGSGHGSARRTQRRIRFRW